MRHRIYVYLFVLGTILTSCQVLNAPNIPATLSTQNTAIADEATSIPQSLAGTAAVIARTAIVAETNVAELNSINRQLIATMNAVIPPTFVPQIVAVPNLNGAGTSSAPVESLVDIGVTARKRDSDGCADGTQSQFSVDTAIIYAIARATTISAGAKISVEWKYQGQVVSSGNYDVTADQSNFCIWFPLDPATIPFTQGSWSVQFVLNEKPVEPTIFFNIGDVQTPSQ